MASAAGRLVWVSSRLWVRGDGEAPPGLHACLASVSVISRTGEAGGGRTFTLHASGAFELSVATAEQAGLCYRITLMSLKNHNMPRCVFHIFQAPLKASSSSCVLVHFLRFCFRTTC